MPTVKIPYESTSKMADRASSAAQAVLQVDDGSFYSDSDSLLGQVCLLIPCQRLSTSPSDDWQPTTGRCLFHNKRYKPNLQLITGLKTGRHQTSSLRLIRPVEGFPDSTKVRTCSVSLPWLIRFPVEFEIDNFEAD